MGPQPPALISPRGEGDRWQSPSSLPRSRAWLGTSSRVLGGFTDHDGYFENDDYVVTFAVGHLFELLPPEEVDEKYKRWTLDNAAHPSRASSRYKPKAGQSERIRTIKKLLARDDVDDGRERLRRRPRGRADLPRDRRPPRLEQKPVRRLWLQSMTDQRDPRGLRRTPARARSSRGWPRRRLPRAVRLADRHERDAGAHQAAQEPQGEDRLVGGAGPDADARDAGGAEIEILAHVPAPLLARHRQLRARGTDLRGELVRPGLRARTTTTRPPGRPHLRRGARPGHRRPGAGRAGERPARRASPRASRRRRSST